MAGSMHRLPAAALLVVFSIALGCLPVTAEKANRLVTSTSPYLKHHAHNPVDWYPWGDEAFARAKRQDKPIILSIGYSACHWCNVMASESYEDKRIAAYMNQHFVNIKVDKDQLPDVDFTYQSASENMTGTGGWPLTVFMTPDRKPFFIATYITPGNFKALMSALVKKWSGDRQQLLARAQRTADILETKGTIRLKADEPDRAVILQSICNKILTAADTEYGGISAGSKFPMPTVFELAMLCSAKQSAGAVDEKSQKEAGDFVQKTLDNMAAGALQDQLGGGFFRYCTDRAWTRPHFEKLLIDNAALAECYLQGYRLTGSPYWRQAAKNTIDFVLRDMQSPDGLFYTSISADSDKREGEYYLWKRSQLIEALGATEGQWAADLFDIKDTLSTPRLRAVPNAADEQRLNSVRRKLLDYRRRRPAPPLDTQAITAHNALMIHTLVDGYRTMGDTRYLDAARRAGRFILAKLYRSNQLTRSYSFSQVGRPGYLDDYAFMVGALTDIATVDPDGAWLTKAQAMTGYMQATFLDKKSHLWRSGTTAGAPALVVGTIPTDTVAPAAAAVATRDLIEMSRLGDNPAQLATARRVLAAYAPAYAKSWLYSTFLSTLDYCAAPASEVILLSGTNAGAAAPMKALIGKAYLPHSIVVFAPTEKSTGKSANIPLLSAVQGQSAKTPAVYICKNRTCRAPITDAQTLQKALSEL